MRRMQMTKRTLLILAVCILSALVVVPQHHAPYAFLFAAYTNTIDFPRLFLNLGFVAVVGTILSIISNKVLIAIGAIVASTIILIWIYSVIMQERQRTADLRWRQQLEKEAERKFATPAFDPDAYLAIGSVARC
jgi:hypothetical protein